MTNTGTRNGLQHLRALGGLDLTLADGTQALAILSQPKRLALLFYLASATPRGFHRKDTLLALFWPEVPADRARRTLNRAIYYLRHSLGHEVVLSRGDEEIAVDAGRLWCDTVAFDEALDADRADEALELYRGDAAPGFHVDGVPEFERWLESERVRLRRRACEAALALATREEHRGEFALSAHWSHRAEVLAPFDETIIQRRMALLDRAGDRAGALDAYASFSARLQEELGVEPSPETTELYAKLRARTATTSGNAPSTPPAVAADVDAVGAGARPLPQVAAQPTPSLRRGTLHHWGTVAAGIVLVAGGAIALVATARSRAPITLGQRSALAVASEAERWPSLSPDGRTVYYTMSGPGGDELFAQQLDGGNPVPISLGLAGPQRAGNVSPDGRQILFLGNDGIYVMPSLGGQARRVVPRTPMPDGSRPVAILPGNWAPDRVRIVYPERDTLFIQALWSGERRAVASGIDIHSPAWSPDGEWIAFVLGNAGFHIEGNIAPSAIGVVPAGGGAIVPVTDAAALHVSPVWVPGRRSLLFISDRDGDGTFMKCDSPATGPHAPRRRASPPGWIPSA